MVTSIAKLPTTPALCVAVTVPEPPAPVTVNVQPPPAGSLAALCSWSWVIVPAPGMVVVGATKVLPAAAPSLTHRMVTTSPVAAVSDGVTWVLPVPVTTE
jgi:hypothetical protein